MQFELKELSFTLLTGAFVLLAGEALAYYTFGWHGSGFFAGDWGWHRSEKPEHQLPTHLLVIVVFCFPLGLLVEDLCYKGDDALAFPLYRALGMPATSLLDELRGESGNVNRFTLQTVTLVTGLRAYDSCPSTCFVQGPPRPTQEIRITALAYELASRGAFSRNDGDRGAAVERWMRDSAPTDQHSGFFSPFGAKLPPHTRAGVIDLPHCSGAYVAALTREDVRDSVRRLWYNAKNRVYREHEYYEEIERMESRLDFSRTITVVSLLAVFASVAFIFIGEIVALLNRRGREIPLAKSWRRASWLRTLIFLLIYCCATIAYTRESLEINKRVFGYYSSMLHENEAANH